MLIKLCLLCSILIFLPYGTTSYSTVFGTTRYGRSSPNILRSPNPKWIPSTSYGLPTTNYKSQRIAPNTMSPASYPGIYYDPFYSPYAQDYFDEYFYPPEAYPFYYAPTRNAKPYQTFPYFYEDRRMRQPIRYELYNPDDESYPMSDFDDAKDLDGAEVDPENWYENSVRAPPDTDNINTAFLRNLILSQMYSDAVKNQIRWKNTKNMDPKKLKNPQLIDGPDEFTVDQQIWNNPNNMERVNTGRNWLNHNSMDENKWERPDTMDHLNIDQNQWKNKEGNVWKSNGLDQMVADESRDYYDKSEEDDTWPDVQNYEEKNEDALKTLESYQTKHSHDIKRLRQYDDSPNKKQKSSTLSMDPNDTNMWINWYNKREAKPINKKQETTESALWLPVNKKLNISDRKLNFHNVGLTTNAPSEAVTTHNPVTTSTSSPITAINSRKIGQKEFVLLRPATPVRHPFTEPILELLAQQKSQDGVEKKRSQSVYNTIKQLLNMEDSIQGDEALVNHKNLKKRYVANENTLVNELKELKKTSY